jgi:hypothetical protein
MCNKLRSPCGFVLGQEELKILTSLELESRAGEEGSPSNQGVVAKSDMRCVHRLIQSIDAALIEIDKAAIEIASNLTLSELLALRDAALEGDSHR